MLDLLIHDPKLRRQAASRERECVQGQYLWPEISRTIETAYYKVLGWSDHAPNQQAVDPGVRAAPLDRASVI
jgi:hypothetical protein